MTSSAAPQVLTSPGYPNAFRQDVRCRWTIDAPNTTDQVEIMITALNLQTTTECDTEYVEIRDYPLVGSGKTVMLKLRSLLVLNCFLYGCTHKFVKVEHVFSVN